jgi:hypothetical protein
MATIKSYTDLEQSKVLAKILPLESADYHYITQGEKSYFYPYSLSSDAVKHYDENIKYIPCWSLAALLDVIPCGQVNKISGSNKYEASSWNDSGLETPIYTTVEEFDNPVDACVAMIEKLHELNLL